MANMESTDSGQFISNVPGLRLQRIATTGPALPMVTNQAIIEATQAVTDTSKEIERAVKANQDATANLLRLLDRAGAFGDFSDVPN